MGCDEMDGCEKIEKLGRPGKSEILCEEVNSPATEVDREYEGLPSIGRPFSTGGKGWIYLMKLKRGF